MCEPNATTRKAPNVPADLSERIARLLSELLTAQYGEEYGVKIEVVPKKMAAANSSGGI